MVRSPARLVCMLLAVGFVAGGCVYARYSEGSRLDRARIAEIRPGQTTKSEVLAMFGAPQAFSDASVVEKLIDEQGFTPEEIVSLPFADVLVFQFTAGRVEGVVTGIYNDVEIRVVSDALVVFFDDDDTVLYYGYREATDALAK